jgi:uncharacterized SAM-binding protein YcdF (DUF218 family)
MHSQKYRRGIKKSLLGLCTICVIWLISLTITLTSASAQPVDAFFVLGGSIRREIYAAHLAKQHLEIPILISQGSPQPCIWLIFQREAINSPKVWLENCAKSTFENFYYSVPILQQWRVHKVKLITSSTHSLRATLMARILLGAHGMWVEPDLAVEVGVPGNQEWWLKTLLDVIRSLLWALCSQFWQPHCHHIKQLTDMDMSLWQKRGFHCEHQSDI